MVEPLWRTVWRVLKKLKIEIQHDPPIPLLGIYSKKMSTPGDIFKENENMNLSKLRKIVKDREAWCASVHGVEKSQTQLSG